MLLMKSVLFLPNPDEIAKELGFLLLTQVQTTGTVDIPAAQKLILDRSKMVHDRRILSGLSLEDAKDVEEFVQAEEREMEREMAQTVFSALTVVTKIGTESIIEAQS